ncbi:hypothetical protein VL04_21785 [Chromobacterium violaceum]|nr:hypothetical protein VK93_21705 [Chromobacterium violaceum]KMN84413.1 hypothetical protein VL02_20030 [Chromobacterium violaceum]KMN88194.1 hypothetical protein VL04_21785 [Chromobacterium violaceum]KMO03462.1 hypothetical protein VL16_13140 [Chromobacterium violaceum]
MTKELSKTDEFWKWTENPWKVKEALHAFVNEDRPKQSLWGTVVVGGAEEVPTNGPVQDRIDVAERNEARRTLPALLDQHRNAVRKRAEDARSTNVPYTITGEDEAEVHEALQVLAGARRHGGTVQS